MSSAQGDSIRVPGFDFDVPIMVDATCEHPGVVTYEGFRNGPVIRLREWDDRVLLHETLHVLVASWRHSHQREPCLVPGTPEEESFVRHVTHLYELGWRPRAAPDQERPDA